MLGNQPIGAIGDAVLYNIIEGECSQASVNDKYKTVFEEIAGFKDGSCTD